MPCLVILVIAVALVLFMKFPIIGLSILAVFLVLVIIGAIQKNRTDKPPTFMEEMKDEFDVLLDKAHDVPIMPSKGEDNKTEYLNINQNIMDINFTLINLKEKDFLRNHWDGVIIRVENGIVTDNKSISVETVHDFKDLENKIGDWVNGQIVTTYKLKGSVFEAFLKQRGLILNVKNAFCSKYLMEVGDRIIIEPFDVIEQSPMIVENMLQVIYKWQPSNFYKMVDALHISPFSKRMGFDDERETPIIEDDILEDHDEDLGLVRQDFSFNLNDIQSDPLSIFYRKTVVLTGTLTQMERAVAEMTLRYIGATITTAVSSKTDFLIAGYQDGYKINGGLSSKEKKAVSLISKGAKVKIMHEDEFYRQIAESVDK